MTRPPFYRDYGVHKFLRQYQPNEILELIRIPDRRSKNVSLLLRRLYAAVIETFLADCEMAVKMNPSIRQLIVQSDPYVVSGQSLYAQGPQSTNRGFSKSRLSRRPRADI
jgi:hypothetical protein